MPLGRAPRGGPGPRLRRRLWGPLLLAGAVMFIAGCGPTITVRNDTRFPIRAFVSNADKNDVLSPSPGESSSTDAEEGSYAVVVIPDPEWIEYAKATAKYLSARLTQPESLTGPQLLDVLSRLKNIATAMEEFERAARAENGICSGTVGGSSSPVVVVTIDVAAREEQRLAVRCK